ncbi:flagellar biosynthesis protein FlgN [Bradyrhizobium centrolobii]|uniref:Flagellar biosynthesis protein FlgN n=1 Tax=Bradyrhizobium centrolobii TaxID=1505087 RepID=A0A176YE00_9BRAD|nr:hypothetical protein [Bradyrhizobium centrolobii]OAF02573.1 flagellar biosynthesis protein FlgN [Bradyrhizobium centrolobii]
MQADEGAMELVMETREAQTEAVTEAVAGDALLPVHVPDAGGEAMVNPGDVARPDEVSGLLAAIRRLESIVEEETVALATGKKIDFDDFSARKSRSMLEFVRLMRARIHLGGEAEITEEIQRLREKLERNRSILEMHYDAVREVATIILKAIRDAESDGTYSGRATQDRK